MTEVLLGLVARTGVASIFLLTLLSCLAVPVPTSLAMLAAGAFAASGDLSLWQIAAAALAGAVVGDQLGYGAGRLGETRVEAALARRAPAARLANEARATLDRWGGTGVFLSRWLFSPLGPWVNLAAGLAGFGWLRFTVAAAIGEVVWVAIYVGLGFVFADNIEAVSELLGNSVGLLVAALATAGFGLLLRRALRRNGDATS